SFDLENPKTAQAHEIDSLKRRVKKLERRQKSKTHGLKRLYKVGLSARVESSDEESLGEEDASKPGRNIVDIDADREITLVGAVEKVNAASIATSVTATTAATTSTVSMDEIKLAKALIEIKTSRPKAKGIVMQEASETPTLTLIVSCQQPSKVQDKGKVIMVEPKIPLKKNAQISLDEELSFKLQAEEKEQERIVREKAQLQAEEQEQLTDAENARLFKEFLEKRKKFFAKLFDKAMETINHFVDFTELVKESTKKDNAEIVQESSSNRVGDEIEQEKCKKQKVEDDKEQEELKKCLEIIPDDGDDVNIDATPLSSKPLTIVDYKIYKKGRKSYFQIFKADGNSQIMRMEQYLTHTDYALWEVIVNGDSPASIASVSGGAEATLPPKTTEQKIARRNELKAKTIKTRFGGNKESKKMQKTILKQQYENFAASRSEGLDKTYERFQKLINQLEFHGEVISQEDTNLKLLRSLPPAWNTHTLIMRNKLDLDTLSMNDLYNNLKVYEDEINGQSNSSLNSQNVAFVSSDNTSRTNEAVNTAHDVSAASSQRHAFASTYADDVMFSFFANQYNSLQLDNIDLEQIDTDDLEDMDLKWQVYPAQILRDLNNESDVFESASDSSINESEEDNNQATDRYKEGEGYHAVPPPYTRNFMPQRPGLSFTGLDDSVFKSESDSDDDCEIRPSIEQNKPNHPKINFVKSDENTRKSVIEQQTYKQAENLRKS
nr:hypothetical protein [Tanacetum cinerariifolium]